MQFKIEKYDQNYFVICLYVILKLYTWSKKIKIMDYDYEMMINIINTIELTK